MEALPNKQGASILGSDQFLRNGKKFRTPLPDDKIPPLSWSSERSFILQQYVNSHNQLILESFGNNQTDIVKIVFSGVERIEVDRSYRGGIDIATVNPHEFYRQSHPLVKPLLWTITSPNGTGFVAASRVRIARLSHDGEELEVLFAAHQSPQSGKSSDDTRPSP
ncbi:hypothetical protein [Amycolatopsis taiwanensis]|uniref:hypothetical protein n=1 Tax=Amycolatopsis taiwanensis TaxID=342230 RepID=UPI002553E4F7|nr:hypothetical protein [Amycolatopsis taiwanensis]